jgi:hypothetical protein
MLLCIEALLSILLLNLETEFGNLKSRKSLFCVGEIMWFPAGKVSQGGLENIVAYRSVCYEVTL